MNHTDRTDHTDTAHPARRAALASLLAITALAWSACAMTPPTERRAERRRALESLEFTESGDGWSLNLAGRVLFAPDESELVADGAATIAQVSRVLLGVGIDRLLVEGHTDNIGSEDHNKRLSERRAEAVARELVQRGFDDRLVARRGLGSTRPIADNTTEAGRSKNRRATLIVASI